MKNNARILLVADNLRDLGLRKIADRFLARFERPEEGKPLTAEVLQQGYDQLLKVVSEKLAGPLELGAAADFSFKIPRGLSKGLGPDIAAILEDEATRGYEGMVTALSDSFHNELSNLLQKFLSRVREDFGNQGVASIEDVLKDVFAAVADSFFQQAKTAVVDGIGVIFEEPSEEKAEESKTLTEKDMKKKGAKEKKRKASALSDDQVQKLAGALCKKGQNKLAETLCRLSGVTLAQ